MQAVFDSTRHSIVVLGMGGTIAGEGDDPSQTLSYQAGARSVARLMADLPLPCRVQIEATGCAVIGESVAQIDSKDIQWMHWWELARRVAYWLDEPSVKGLVVTHGTDTLEETAWFLDQVLGHRCRFKPVVITCAMRPATAADADGPQNLADAVLVAASGTLQGVVACVAGEVFSAQSVQKVHPTRLNAFDGGPMSRVATVHSGAVVLENPGDAFPLVSQSRWDRWLAPETPIPKQPWVECVWHTGAASLQLLPLLASAGVDGVVVAATGNGTINEAWLTQLQSMSAAGVAVRCATRCSHGALVGDKEKGQTFSGLAFYSELNAVKSRVQLSLDLL
jgi:L-asparaginase